MEPRHTPPLAIPAAPVADLQTTLSEAELAAAFTEWDRRYREEPTRFQSEAARLLYETPETYGQACAPYLLAILAEQRQGSSGRSQATRPALAEGETYLGAIISADGTYSQHTILLPGDHDDATWQDAMDWAKSLGGDLPNRIEQALLLATLKDQFQKDWYWSNTQFASDASSAWCQYFRYGNQSSTLIYGQCRARAVRRLPIQPFTNLL